MKWFEIFFHIEILKITEKSDVCDIKSARICVSQKYFPTDVKLTIIVREIGLWLFYLWVSQEVLSSLSWLHSSPGFTTCTWCIANFSRRESLCWG